MRRANGALKPIIDYYLRMDEMREESNGDTRTGGDTIRTTEHYSEPTARDEFLLNGCGCAS